MHLQPNIHLPIRPVKQYRALITQVGTAAPTVDIQYNTIGDIVWTRENQGVYKGTLNKAFKTGKTDFRITLNNTGKTGTMYADINDENSVIINTNDYAFTSSDDCLKDTPITILVKQ